MTSPVRPPSAPLWSRRATLVLGAATLIAAVLGGLERMALGSLAPDASVALHGPLMVCGFFGVVISLERAVALSGRWPLAAPACAVAASFLVVSGHVVSGAALFLLSSLVLLVLCGLVVRRQLALFTVVMALGAAAWVVGNALWLSSGALSAAVWWWVAFLVVTIAAERLELSRLVRRPRHAELAFALCMAALFLGLGLARLRLVGVALVTLSLWLALHDVARRTIRRSGLARYAAAALLSGFFWLAIGGALLVVRPEASIGAGLWYDAVLHSVLVGFVLAMVFAHAPIILPAVARIDLRYQPALYLPLALLHLSLLARVSGDLLGYDELRQAGGLGNAITLVAFALVALAAALRRRWRSHLAPALDTAPTSEGRV